jgi:hypothetical protein
MISPQDVNANSYDDLIKFVISGTPNVSKVKLKLTVDFEGVENFNIPNKTVIDAISYMYVHTRAHYFLLGSL